MIQLVNCSKETLLGAANAAYRPGHEPTSVMPREKTWVMEPVGAKGNKNVLTIDIPMEWENTKCKDKNCKAVGPRFWARTGCRYDIEKDIAQCETGGCSGRYDCSKARQSASVGTSIAEWTIAEPRANHKTSYLQDAPDISAVDGVNLNIDIQPIGGSSHSPFDEKEGSKWINHEYEWLAEQYPLTQHGQDLRADSICPASHRWKRSQLVRDKPYKNVYGMVIIDDNSKPASIDAKGKIISNGDATIGCWSNCGKMAWPTAPPMNCDASDKHSRCWAWKVLCAGDDRIYGQKCKTDKDCQVGASCYDLHDTSPNNLTCQARGYVKKLPCPPDVCTYQYGWKDPWMGITHYEFQPPLALCSTYLPDADQCIGEDTMKKVMPKAYTWPNDPQVYVGDSPVYRVIFAPGGTNVPITPAGPVPACQDLPKHYNYVDNLKNCAIDVQNGAEFAIAFPHSTITSGSFTGQWGCKMDIKGAGDEGVICRWKKKVGEE